MVGHQIKQALWIVVILGVIACAGKLAVTLDGTITKTNKSVVQTFPILSLEDSIQRTIGSVVHVRNNTAGWQGSGVAIASDIVLTARHVVENSADFEITTNDGQKYKTTSAISSKKYDLGFIKLNESVLKPATFGSIKNCRLGQQMFVIGSPMGKVHFNAVTLGILSKIPMDPNELKAHRINVPGWSVLFMSDVATWGGNSGSPVFTLDGAVRGILVGGYGPEENTSYCIPVDVVITDIDVVQRMFEEDAYRFEEGFVPTVTVTEDY